MPNRLTAIAAVIGFTFLAILMWSQRERVLLGQNDFSQLYAGATLVGTGNLYSKVATQKVILANTGITMEGVLYFSRPPFYALFLKPLTWLPYLTAYRLFLVLSLAALLTFVWLFQRMLPELPLFACFSIPALVSLMNGQDTLILLLIAGTAYILARSARDFAAGLVLSLCAIKFHLFLLPWAVFAWYRRWTGTAGFATGGVILLALSFAAEGWDWPQRYLAAATSPELHPGAEYSPTLQSLELVLPGALKVGSILVLANLFWIALKARDWDTVFGHSLTAGLLLGYHAYIQDGIVILLAFAILGSTPQPPVVRGMMALATTPPLWLLLMAGSPLSAVVPATLTVILQISTLSMARNSRM